MTTGEKLQKLLQGFEIKIFDPDDNKSGITTQVQKNKEPQEIDAVAIKQNMLILISIYSGNIEQDCERKIGRYFRRLKYLTNIEDLNLVVNNPKSSRGRESQAWIKALEQRVAGSSYRFVVIKLFFCPNIHVPLGKIANLVFNESVIDKDHFNYFEYALNNIGYIHTERELFYFLKIKKRDIERKKESRGGEEPELTSDFPAVETKLGVNQKMYSTCTTVNDLIEYVQVLRLANEYDLRAFQRMINGDRLKKISKHYLNKHDIFPNSIILAFNPELYDPSISSQFIIRENNHTKIKFYKEFGSLIIVDGQHRILAHLLQPERDINKPILANIILFLDREKAYKEMAELFYIINTQHKRLASLVSLKIRAKLNPEELESVWYEVFEKLNNLNQRDNYLYGKICFEETELRKDRSKLSIVSIVKYAGLKMITNGTIKNQRKYLGLKDLGERCVNENYSFPDFYQNFLRKYFSIIGEMLEGNQNSISARDLGGLLRLTIHFINDPKTKNLFINLSKEQGPIPVTLKQNIKNYLNKIPFSRLSDLVYGANEWRSMEGFFLGCIRKHYKGFGFGNLLSKKGKSALNKGRQFI